MHEKIKEIADFMIEYGTKHTYNGNYIFCIEYLVDVLNVTPEFVREHEEDILNELYSREEIVGEIWMERNDDFELMMFDLDFGIKYCPNIIHNPVEEAYKLAIQIREKGDITLIDEVIGYLGQALE